MVSSAPDTSVAAAAQSQHSHPGLTWLCLSACVWGGRYPVNPTSERLLYGAEADSALSRLRQSCPHSPARFSPSTDTSPWFSGISSLGFLTIKIRDEVRPSSWEVQSGLCGTPAPMDWQAKEWGTNGTGASHKQKDLLSARGSQNIQHYKGRILEFSPKPRAWKEKLEQIYQL